MQSFEGVISNFERRYNNTESNFVREELNKYLSKQICGECNGTRLSEDARNVFINDKILQKYQKCQLTNVYFF